MDRQPRVIGVRFRSNGRSSSRIAAESESAIVALDVGMDAVVSGVLARTCIGVTFVRTLASAPGAAAPDSLLSSRFS